MVSRCHKQEAVAIHSEYSYYRCSACFAVCDLSLANGESNMSDQPQANANEGAHPRLDMDDPETRAKLEKTYRQAVLGVQEALKDYCGDKPLFAGDLGDIVLETCVSVMSNIVSQYIDSLAKENLLTKPKLESASMMCITILAGSMKAISMRYETKH